MASYRGAFPPAIAAAHAHAYGLEGRARPAQASKLSGFGDSVRATLGSDPDQELT